MDDFVEEQHIMQVASYNSCNKTQSKSEIDKDVTPAPVFQTTQFDNFGTLPNDVGTSSSSEICNSPFRRLSSLRDSKRSLDLDGNSERYKSEINNGSAPSVFQKIQFNSSETLQSHVGTVDASSTGEICDSPFRGFGMLCCVLSGVMFSFNALLVKVVKSSTALQLSASRCIIQFLFLLPYITYHWYFYSHDIIGPPGTNRFLLLRGFLGSSAAICLYQSVQRISLGDAVTLMFSNVIFAGCLGCCLLKEAFTVLDGIMSLFAMSGILLIARPTFIFGSYHESDHSKEPVSGVLFGVAAGVLSGLTYIIIRKIGRVTHASLNVLYYSLCGSISATVLVVATDAFAFPCLHEIPFIVLIGITGLGGQVLMTIGLRFERASTFATLRSFQIVFVFILQVVILEDTPSVLSVAGSGLIFCSVFSLAIRKVYNSTKRNQKKRKSAKQQDPDPTPFT